MLFEYKFTQICVYDSSHEVIHVEKGEYIKQKV